MTSMSAGSAASPNVSKQISTSPSWANCSFTRRIVCGRGLRGGGGDRPQPLERAAQQPRHVHLRDADLLGDLVLEHVVLEAHLEDQALALRERTHPGGQRAAVVDRLEALIECADAGAQVVAGIVVAAVARGVE